MNAPVAKRPAWFWAVAVLALLWNVFGLAMFYLQYTMSPEQLAQLPEAQRGLQEGFPDWLWALYAVAVVAGTLEMSNVDLATEFTDMIVAQRGYQASARLITTSDEMLQETVQLKR